jgi:AcrR family transcriptional regulator
MVGTDRTTPVRSARVDRTRRSILDAARRLFAQRGYAQTPVRMLAREAGVAVRTVYLSFGSKQGVLMALVDFIGEDAGTIETREAAVGLVDGPEMIALVARLYRNLYERSSDVIDMVQQGAAVEPELRVALRHGHGNSRASIEATCVRLSELSLLRSDLTVDEAAGHCLVLVSRDGYEEMVELRNWSPDTYESWLCRALQTALLRPGLVEPRERA